MENLCSGITSLLFLTHFSFFRYQKVEISDEELAKLKEKAVVEQKRIASLSTAYNTAKKQNEERDRIEAERLAVIFVNAYEILYLLEI